MDRKKMGVGINTSKLLKFMGIYVEEFTPISVLKLVFVLISYHTITIGLWGHLIHFLNNNQFAYECIADDVAGIISSYISLYSQASFIAMSKECRTLLSDLGDFKGYDVPDGYAKMLDKIDTYFKYVAYFIVSSEVGIALFLLARHCEEGDESDCGLVITAYLPFDIFYTPARQIFMLLQLYSGFGSGLATVCILVTCVFFMQCLVAQIKHLEKLLMEISGLKTRERRQKHIKKCVLYHYRILELCDRAASITEIIFFIFVFLISVTISLTSYQLVALKVNAVTVIHLTAYLITILICCRFGEILIHESQKLNFCVYDAIPWDGDCQSARDLYIIMMASSKELSLPAGKFGPVGHIRYMMILKGSYSFLTLLLNAK